MKKILSFCVATVFIFGYVVSSAHAAVRLRTNRYTQPTTTVVTPYYQPQYTTYQPQYQNSGYTYYFSSTYLAGYTYSSTPTPGYYYYGNTPSQAQTPISQGQYYFSPTYVNGYTYYSTPTPGYYYYFQTAPLYSNNGGYYTTPYNGNNTICTIINGYYQCSNAQISSTYGTYPGCTKSDILIGGQVWAGCNSLDRNSGSSEKSGWFLSGDAQASFVSYNGSNTTLEWLGKQTQTSGYNIGPCATGYRLPTRGEWETLQSYARANGSTVSAILSLPQNGAYQTSRNTNGDVVINGRLGVNAAYWTSTYSSANPIVMHVGSQYAGYNTTGTDYGYVNNRYQWTYSNAGLDLIASTTGEMANVRCIRN